MNRELYELAARISNDAIINPNTLSFTERIGVGGYGEVWKAIYIPTGKVCAVKKLFMDELDEDNLEMYKREVEILARVRSPLTLHLIGFTITKPYMIVTPFIPHNSLFDYVSSESEKGRLPSTNLTIIAMGIAYSMMKLHEMGVIHRDLKSPNVLLDNKYLPYVSDFGIAKQVIKHIDPLTRDIGTTNWMAPEQMSSNKYDNKVDVYSYGMILYEMVMNRIPFQGMKPIEITMSLKKGKRPQLTEEGNESIIKLIKKCWKQNPASRPTFHHIYHKFVKEKIMFDGTNPKGIHATHTLIQKDEQFLKQSRFNTT